jgi:hypothetical protein
MLNTLNYSEQVQSFWSFTSSKPKWYLNFGNSYYSFDEDNKLYKHNSGVITDNSIVKYIVNDAYQATKSFDNIEYSPDFENSINFNKIDFKTNTMTSKSLMSSDIDKREDTYKAAIPREVGVDKFAGRMKGKYLISELLYIPVNGSRFNLPYIKTSYRQSMI